MTEPTEAPAPAAEAPANRRGRPRPDVTIQRDEQVFELLAEPLTRGQLVERTGLKPTQVYLALYRLRKADRVQKSRSGANHVWSRTAAPTG